MKPIEQGELYQHLSGFLKKKGVELHEGPYPGRLEQVCRLLTETINATQGTLERAKKGVDRGFEQVRQVLQKKRGGKGAGGSTVSAAMEAERSAVSAKREGVSGKRRSQSAERREQNGKRSAAKAKVAKPKRAKKKVAGVRSAKRQAVRGKREGKAASGKG